MRKYIFIFLALLVSGCGTPYMADRHRDALDIFRDDIESKRARNAIEQTGPAASPKAALCKTPEAR